MPEPENNTRARSALIAAAGALIFTLGAIAFSLWFLRWRGAEQLRVLTARSVLCQHGDASACDLLRNVCLKRNGDGCVALADAELAAGPRRDANEGARLLAEACEFRHRDACLRAGQMLLDGHDVPKDETQALALLDRGCELQLKAACTLHDSAKH